MNTPTPPTHSFQKSICWVIITRELEIFGYRIIIHYQQIMFETESPLWLRLLQSLWCQYWSILLHLKWIENRESVGLNSFSSVRLFFLFKTKRWFKVRKKDTQESSDVDFFRYKLLPIVSDVIRDVKVIWSLFSHDEIFMSTIKSCKINLVQNIWNAVAVERR